MQCHHFDAGRCRSCTLLSVPHAHQVADAGSRYRRMLAPFVAAGGADVWGPPVTSADAHFRATAKMVVTGSANDPVLGILRTGSSGADVAGGENGADGPDDAGGHNGADGVADADGVDLVDCPLYPPGVQELLEDVRALIRRAQVPPYSVPRRRGELKYVLVTTSPTGEHMLRLVLRSEQAIPRIREHLGRLLTAQPQVRVVSANIHPEHKAVVEGPREVHLAGEAALRMRMAGLGDDRAITLQARPGAFVQTNSAVAAQLYAQVSEWIDEIDPGSVWDLYCGVGGFALHCAPRAGNAAGSIRAVTGVEISPGAIDSARAAARDAGLDADFHAADATGWAIDRTRASGPPDALIVNPPRRGIGTRLAAWIHDSGVTDVVYSSCNPRTLAEDLQHLPSYRITAARLVDMFPHTRHDELVVRLRRITNSW